jgi:dienelactone hydrolase
MIDTRVLWSQAKRGCVWLVALTLIATTAGTVYFEMPFHGSPESIADVEQNPNVAVTERGDAYVMEPAQAESEVGLVFYPGGRVHPDAYLASLAPIVSEVNATVVVPEMRLNLAIFEQDAASRYIAGSPIETWYVGGHSLGGSMACRYAANNLDRVEGLVLFASYCDRDLSGTGLDVLSVTGSADTVLNRARYERGLDHLPSDATVRELQLNHSQFGSYRGQRGDRPSDVSYAAAHEALGDVTVEWIRSRQIHRPANSSTN